MGRAKHSNIPLTFDDIDSVRTLISVFIDKEAGELTVQYAPFCPAMAERSRAAVRYLQYQCGGLIPPGNYTFWCNNWYGFDGVYN